MLNTSSDALNLAIAISVVGFTAFTCWAIYYFARILQQGYHIIHEFRTRLSKLDELIKTLKEKIEHTTSYLLLISEGVKKLVEVIRDRSEKREGKE